jgi:N-acetylglucosamine kinase-like BadF-type ATPase
MNKNESEITKSQITKSANDLVLGIDGGGTKTAVWLSTVNSGPDDPPLGCGASGPGNPRSAGFEVAFCNIEAAVAAAFDDAGVSKRAVRTACLALAGADRPVERDRLNQWCAEKGLAERVVLTNDADPLLAAGSPDNWGIALIAGTGSIAFGRDRAGQTARCGGWGYLLGDEGSGYAIALAGLREATRAADGRSAPTKLLALFQKRLQVSTPQGLIEAIYRPEVSRQQIADLSDVVFEAAESNDKAAIRLVETAAVELAELVRTLVHQLQLPPDQFPLALAGGLLLHHNLLRTGVQKQMARHDVAPEKVTLVPDPVRGAVILARRATLGSR